ncbi:hypothetical protein ACFYO0_18430 [Streptomyces sp. NPDC006365]|uniref:hypothetical protein n=1 Tax=Streptomyces sp. NPDC006365 TaxID=3364744 RepID=UPI0036C06CF1
MLWPVAAPGDDRACAEQCEVSQERQLAQGMAEGQQSEMRLMAEMLKERGSAPR